MPKKMTKGLLKFIKGVLNGDMEYLRINKFSDAEIQAARKRFEFMQKLTEDAISNGNYIKRGDVIAEWNNKNGKYNLNNSLLLRFFTKGIIPCKGGRFVSNVEGAT
jgi:hypothetical protein